MRANIRANRYGSQLKREKKAEVQRKFGQMLDSIERTMAKFALQEPEDESRGDLHIE